jgi:hypothetical protein
VIGAEFYKGQGFGNQLWIYASVRSIAEKHGYEFGFLGTKNFKGKAFLNLDFGNQCKFGTSSGPVERIPDGFKAYLRENPEFHPVSGADITPLDRKVLNIQDGFFIDGALQSEGYIFESRDQVSKWFHIQGEQQNKCVISLRGGEYRGLSEVFLPQSYYMNAIERIKQIDPRVEFEVVTDDLQLANEYFPDLPAYSSGGVKILLGRFYFSPQSTKIGSDFAKIQSARYLILSNSSFSWWGAYTNPYVQHVIAPKYWARHNISDGYWSQGDSLTSEWEWLDRAGNFSNFQECQLELSEYRARFS